MSTSPLSARVRAISESPTLAVTAKAKSLRAAGKPVIGFGAGEPDFPTPAHIVEAAAAACAEPSNHRYSAASGLPELRQAIAEKTARDSRVEASSDMVVVTNGGKHALYSLFQAIIDPGDEVLIPAPYWVSYPEMVQLAGGVAVTVPTTPATGFRATIEQLEASTTERTKALIFVSPSNPTGAVYSPESVAEVGRWAAERGIWVITDEIYEHLVYGDARFTSLPAVVPDAAPTTIIVNGVAKTYAMTGWRVGWVVAPKEVAGAIGRLQSHMTSNVSNVAQRAALAAITGPQDPVAEMRTAFDRRRHAAVDGLRAIDGVDVVEPEGAFYVFPSFEGVLGRQFEGRKIESTLDLADVLLDEVNVALVPGEGFGAPGFVRLSYALGDEDLREGIDRIRQLVGRLD